MEAASPPSAPLGIYPEGSRRIMRSSSSASEEPPHGFPPRLPHFTPPPHPSSVQGPSFPRPHRHSDSLGLGRATLMGVGAFAPLC